MSAPEDDLDLSLNSPPPPDPASVGVRVVLAESALDAVNSHASAESHHEIGGILIGEVAEGSPTVVVIEDIIPGTEMRHTGSSVTFTHETWDQINQVKDRDFPQKKVVGWYHSHPGFGIFLSGHDLFIHRNFFTQPWQVALVTDPRAGTHGCFTWQSGDLQKEPQVMTYRVTAAAELPALSSPAPEAEIVPAMLLPASPRAAASTPGFTWALGILGLLLAAVLAVTLANYRLAHRLQGEMAAVNEQIQALQANTSPPAIPSAANSPTTGGDAAPAPAGVPPVSSVVPSSPPPPSASAEGEPSDKSPAPGS